MEANHIIPDLPLVWWGCVIFSSSRSLIWGVGTCANRYPGHRSFDHDYDWERIATGWVNLETGMPQHWNFKKKYCKKPKCPRVQSRKGKMKNPPGEGSCNSTIHDHYSRGHCKFDDAFTMHKHSCWTHYRVFRPHSHSKIIWGIETR